MNVRLIQLDGSLPNLALMKLAHWHRSQGDEIVLPAGAKRMGRKIEHLSDLPRSRRDPKKRNGSHFDLGMAYALAPGKSYLKVIKHMECADSKGGT